MSKFIKDILLWVYLKYHSFMSMIGVALYNTENEILKASPIINNEKSKHVQRHRHRNNLLEKFYAGKRDEKYVQDYYEILKKADHFLKTATPHKMAVAADRHGSNYGLKDIYGRRYEHYGFFDAKHKHSGKTLGEVLDLEMNERKTNDDNYELLFIFNNTPIDVGLSNVDKILEANSENNDDYVIKNIFEKSKCFEFPLKVVRDQLYEPINKIEQLTEFLHVKRIGFEVVQLEFFIPLKFNTKKIEENSDIFKDIINFRSIFVKNQYGENIWYGIDKFNKRIDYNNTHEVWKFIGFEMKDLGIY